MHIPKEWPADIIKWLAITTILIPFLILWVIVYVSTEVYKIIKKQWK